MWILKMCLLDVLQAIKLRAALCGLRPVSFVLQPSSFPRRRGQAVVEYLLLLAVMVTIAVTMLAVFRKGIMGGIFTIVGSVIGSET